MAISSISNFFHVNPDKTGIKSLGLSDEEKFKYVRKVDSDQANFAARTAEVTGQTVNGNATAGTLWETQSYAQSEQSDAIDVEVADADTKVKEQSATEKFLDFMNKTPEEMMREAVLKELGYTEEDVANMTPDERAKVEQEIKTMIETKIEEAMREKGIDIDSANKVVENANSVLTVA